MMQNKWEASPYKNPLARARGIGSARNGTHHWIMQKVTAVANIPLALWAIYSMRLVVAGGGSYDAVRVFFSQPIHAILMLMFLLSVFYHMALGLQVVVEDYVHCERTKIVYLVGSRIVIFGLTVASVFSILRLSM